jgi:hypothetical protein
MTSLRSSEVFVQHWIHDRRLTVLQSDVVVDGLTEFLLAPEILLCCLNGYMPKQKLNLLKFPACQVA